MTTAMSANLFLVIQPGSSLYFVPVPSVVHLLSSLPPPDLRSSGVDCVTLGQYMQPTKRHLKVELYLLHDSTVKPISNAINPNQATSCSHPREGHSVEIDLQAIYLKLVTMYLYMLIGERIRDPREIQILGRDGGGAGIRLHSKWASCEVFVQSWGVLHKEHTKTEN